MSLLSCFVREREREKEKEKNQRVETCLSFDKCNSIQISPFMIFRSSLDDVPTSVLSACRVCKIFSRKSGTCSSLLCPRIATGVDVNCTSTYTFCRKGRTWIIVAVAVVAVAAAIDAVTVSYWDPSSGTDSSTSRWNSFLSATDRPP